MKVSVAAQTGSAVSLQSKEGWEKKGICDVCYHSNSYNKFYLDQVKMFREKSYIPISDAALAFKIKCHLNHYEHVELSVTKNLHEYVEIFTGYHQHATFQRADQYIHIHCLSKCQC